MTHEPSQQAQSIGEPSEPYVTCWARSIGPRNPKTREDRLNGRVLLFTYSYGP